jgi:hypothetical protein
LQINLKAFTLAKSLNSSKITKFLHPKESILCHRLLSTQVFIIF